MNYPKKARNYILTPNGKKVGKAIARGSKKAVVNECTKHSIMRKYIVQMLGR